MDRKPVTHAQQQELKRVGGSCCLACIKHTAAAGAQPRTAPDVGGVAGVDCNVLGPNEGHTREVGCGARVGQGAGEERCLAWATADTDAH